jgi:competence protein ComEC
MIPGKHDKVDNERSMCVLFQTENCAILITGDRSTVGEKALLQQVALPPVDILIAGHHGSGSSTGMELLTKIQPKIAVISVAENNYYGLPAEQTLYRLRLFGCRVYRTDLEGTIVFKG